jgi:hypothetical protein
LFLHLFCSSTVCSILIILEFMIKSKIIVLKVSDITQVHVFFPTKSCSIFIYLARLLWKIFRTCPLSSFFLRQLTHPSSPSVFSGIRFAKSLVFCVILCISYLVPFCHCIVFRFLLRFTASVFRHDHRFRLMVFNATFNNISAISCQCQYGWNISPFTLKISG